MRISCRGISLVCPEYFSVGTGHGMPCPKYSVGAYGHNTPISLAMRSVTAVLRPSLIRCIFKNCLGVSWYLNRVPNGKRIFLFVVY